MNKFRSLMFICAFGVKLLLKLINGIRILALGNVCFATPAKRLIIFCCSEGLLLSLLLNPKDRMTFALLLLILFCV